MGRVPKISHIGLKNNTGLRLELKSAEHIKVCKGVKKKTHSNTLFIVKELYSDTSF